MRSKGHWGYPDEWQAAWRADLDVTADQIARGLGERPSASVPGRVLPVLARRVPAAPAG